MVISKPLLKQTIKSNWKLWTVITGVLVLMMLLITVIMGPKMLEMVEKIPGAGSAMAGQNLNTLLGMMFYGQMGVMLPMLYVIITANSLIAGQVDRGSMAYTLSTPTKRTTVTITQMTYLLGATFLMCAACALFNVIGMALAGVAFDLGQILMLNLGMFLLQAAIGGIAFMFSCIFNLSKHSLALGAGVPVFFYIMSIVGQMGTEQMVQMGMGSEILNSFNYITIMSLYDTNAIMNSSGSVVWQLLALLGISVLVFTIGNLFFKKKDLPL